MCDLVGRKKIGTWEARHLGGGGRLCRGRRRHWGSKPKRTIFIGRKKFVLGKFQIFASIQTSVRDFQSARTHRGETWDGFHRVGQGLGLTEGMYGGIRSGDGSNERAIVP